RYAMRLRIRDPIFDRVVEVLEEALVHLVIPQILRGNLRLRVVSRIPRGQLDTEVDDVLGQLSYRSLALPRLEPKAAVRCSCSSEPSSRAMYSWYRRMFCSSVPSNPRKASSFVICT